MLIDLLLYKPKWLVAAPSVAASCLKFHEELGTMATDTALEEIAPDLIEDMTTAERALRAPISIPWKSRFVKGPAVHV